jgi:hypothetical protein
MSDQQQEAVRGLEQQIEDRGDHRGVGGGRPSSMVAASGWLIAGSANPPELSRQTLRQIRQRHHS